MISWEWVDENPVMTEKQFAKFLRFQFHDVPDRVEFERDCQPYRVEGGYQSAQVVGLAGY